MDKKTSGGGVSATSSGNVQELSEVSQMLVHLMAQFDTKLQESQDITRSEIKALNSKMEALALRDHVGPELPSVQAKSQRGNRVSFGGSDSVPDFAQDESETLDKRFDGDSRRNSNRFSFGSTSSNGGVDAGTKLERPKFFVERSYMKDGIKMEILQDSDYLNFLDEFDAYIIQWKNLPKNEGLPYPNAAKVGVISIPSKYARKMCNRIKWVFDIKELGTFGSVKTAKTAKFWEDIDTATLRIEIGKKVEKELSSKGVLDAIRRVKWNSTFGIADILAFANFQHEFKRTVLRLQSGGVITVEQVHMKDILIAALPDKKLQGELTTTFGPPGIILGNPDDFAINSIFDHIEQYIQTLSKFNLGKLVNKQNREREMFSQGKKLFQLTADDDEEGDALFPDEEQEDFQEHVNAAMASPSPCRFVGLGSDGKLKCKWLAGEQEKCSFKHPESDIQHKGKGVSKDVTMSQKHTRKVNMTQFEEESEAEDS